MSVWGIFVVTESIYRPQRNWGCRIHDYTVKGMRLIVLENDVFRIGVLAGKGADIVELNYKPRDVDMIWLNPSGGIRNPLPHATTAPSSNGAFDEIYLGGWQEMFPHALGAETIDGTPHRYHGEVHSLPWDVTIVEDSPEGCAVTFSVRMTTSPCLIERTIRIETGKAGFRQQQVVRNDSPMPTSFDWGHHITFGPPYLGPGSRVAVPDGVTVHALPGRDDSWRRGGQSGTYPWPIASNTGVDMSVLPERGSLSEMLFLTGFAPGEAWYEVTPAEAGPTCRISWDETAMPVLWYWQEFGHAGGYPWFGRVYTIGLEMNTGMPTSGKGGPHDVGGELTLGAGESREFWLELAVRDGEN